MRKAFVSIEQAPDIWDVRTICPWAQGITSATHGEGWLAYESIEQMDNEQPPVFCEDPN